MSQLLLTPEEQLKLQIIEDLNKPRGEGLNAGLKFRLHKSQIEDIKLIKNHGVSLLIVPSGRKYGKTEEAGFFLWDGALNEPGSANYYIAPESSHGRKIVWDTWRLQRFLDEDSDKYIKSIKNMEMKIEFKNGSFIQVIGSENFGAANGLTPWRAVYDEFKLFHHRWHIDFAPNLIAKAAPLMIIGTLPTPGDRNYDQYYDVLEAAKKDPSARIQTRTTFDNPINLLPKQKKAIEEEIARLRARGEEDVVQREYYSRIVPGGKKAIFPMLNKDCVIPANELRRKIAKDIKKLEWYCITDPGTTTCFAALIVALNPYTKEVFMLDEIYEKDQNMTSSRMIYPRLEALMLKHNPYAEIRDDWIKVVDEAAAWFAQEVLHQYDVYFSPTNKSYNKKEEGLSLIKDQLIHTLFYISSDCPNLYEEMEKYARDDKGNIPKRNDHLIDCVRYFNGAANYTMVEVIEAVRIRSEMVKGRFRTMSHGEDEEERLDWTDSIFNDMD